MRSTSPPVIWRMQHGTPALGTAEEDSCDLISSIPSTLPLPPIGQAIGTSLQAASLQLGGLALPSVRDAAVSLRWEPYPVPPSRPASLLVANPKQMASTNGGPKRSSTPAPAHGQTFSSRVDALSRVRQPSQSNVIQQLWNQLHPLVLDYSALLRDVAASQYRDLHIAKILDNFAATTLVKYLQAIYSFMVVSSAMHVEVQSLTPVQLADVLLVVRLSRSSDDRYVHVSSIIKALRWGVRHLGLDCFQCAHSAIVGRLLHTKIPKDVRESLPLSLFTIIGWEQKVLTGNTSPLLAIILGSFLFQAWTGLRWADLQRVSPSSLVFDFQDIRGLAWRTKTTTKGQAFGCVAHGFMSASTHTWLLVWLRHLDVVFKEADSASVDFLIPRIVLNNDHLELSSQLEPMRYVDALYYLRKYVTCPWKQGMKPMFVSSNYTVHGLKATLLSWSSQVSSIPEEWRRQQGHHRAIQQSVRLYSRDDVYPQLRLQQAIISEVQRGFRPKTPLHRGGQHPVMEPQINLERFKKEADVVEWAFFHFPPSPSQVVEHSEDVEDLVVDAATP